MLAKVAADGNDLAARVDKVAGSHGVGNGVEGVGVGMCLCVRECLSACGGKRGNENCEDEGAHFYH